MCFKLDRKDVEAQNFGWDTLDAMQKIIMKVKDIKDYKQAFKEVSGLNKAQAMGVSLFNLSRKDVEKTPKFGLYTLRAMFTLKQKNSNLNDQEAFAMVSGLNKNQINGVLFYNLRKEQVESPNFRIRTLKDMNTLKSRNIASNNQEAFKIISELSKHQLKGLLYYDLGMEQVQTINFGDYTLKAIDDLMAENKDLSYEEAFKMVAGHNEEEVQRILEEKGVKSTPSKFEQISKGINVMIEPTNSNLDKSGQSSTKRTRSQRDSNVKMNKKPSAKSNKRVRFSLNI